MAVFSANRLLLCYSIIIYYFNYSVLVDEAFLSFVKLNLAFFFSGSGFVMQVLWKNKRNLEKAIDIAQDLW